jgi:uncharacterized membrane protein YhaH (DUF805 family)
MKWYLLAFKNYAKFSGRAIRKEYWYFVLFNIIMSIIASFLDKSIFQHPTTNAFGEVETVSSFGPCYLIVALISIVPALSLGVRRMHDVGKSGWFLLIPIYNLILALSDSEVGENQYGAFPDENTESETI